MAIQSDLSLFVNLFAFFGLTIATYTVFYFGRMLSPTKDISINFFTLALGINLIGLSHLLRIWSIPTLPLVDIAVIAGAIFMLIGVLWVFKQRSIEISNLTKRGKEINEVIKRLKEKYYKQELSEEDLRSAYSGLLRELAEVEVKIDAKKRKRR